MGEDVFIPGIPASASGFRIALAAGGIPTTSVSCGQHLYKKK